MIKSELPKDWMCTKLGEIHLDKSSAITPNKTPGKMFELYSVPNYKIGKPEILFGKEIGSSKKIVYEDTVLLCKINPRINRVWIVGNYSRWVKIASTEWIAFFKQGGVDPKYLKYFMQKEDFRRFLSMNVSGVGGSLMRIKANTFHDYRFPLAPLPEQHKIVEKIEELFTRLGAGVEELKKIKEQLDRYRQLVLKHAFEGKLTEVWREKHKDELEPASVLLEKIKKEQKKDTKRKQMKLPPLDRSKLPELPEGWIWTKFEDISEVNPRFTDDKINNDTDVTFLPMRCVEEITGKLDLSITEKLSKVKKGYKSFINDDLLFAKITPCMENGKIAIAENLKNGLGFGSTEFHVIRLNKILQRKFFFYYLIQESFRKEAKRYMKGTAGQLRVPTNYLKTVPVPFAPLLELHKIVEEIEQRFSVVDEVEKVVDQSLKQAERLRQSILKKAFEGKLVPQDPTDESAVRLLERIKEEKAKYEVATKAKKKIKRKVNKKQRRLFENE